MEGNLIIFPITAESSHDMRVRLADYNTDFHGV
jgi:hypothetical protein